MNQIAGQGKSFKNYIIGAAGIVQFTHRTRRSSLLRSSLAANAHCLLRGARWLCYASPHPLRLNRPQHGPSFQVLKKQPPPLFLLSSSADGSSYWCGTILYLGVFAHPPKKGINTKYSISFVNKFML